MKIIEKIVQLFVSKPSMMIFCWINIILIPCNIYNAFANNIVCLSFVILNIFNVCIGLSVGNIHHNELFFKDPPPRPSRRKPLLKKIIAAKKT
jgi:hypothetical protein